MKPNFNGLRVLLVEDLDEARELTATMLKEMGVAKIYQAGDGHEAYDIFNGPASSVNFVICDWNMPRLDGLGLLEIIRMDGPKIPFLMLTGRGDIDSVSKAKQCGVTGYVRKPFTADQLEVKMRIIMQKQQQ